MALLRLLPPSCAAPPRPSASRAVLALPRPALIDHTAVVVEALTSERLRGVG